MRLDNLDVRIVGLLQDDARLSYREIAQRLDSTTPTISARVKALEDIGLVRGYHARLDHSVLGGSSYVVTLTVQVPAAKAALDALKAMSGVHAAHLLSGGRIVCFVHLRPPAYSLAHLHQALAELAGILTYDASEVIEGHERASVETLPENVEVPCHQCKGPIHADAVKAKFGGRTHVFCCKQCLGAFREKYEAHQTAAKATPAPKARSNADASRHRHA